MNVSSFFKKKQALWIVILLSLGIAGILIWPPSVIETDIFIPVTPEHIPEGLTLSPPFPKGIEFRVYGPSSTVHSLKDRHFQYALDLSGAREGDMIIPVDANAINFPQDITVKKVTPSFLNISIEKEGLKIVPVKISTSGKPASGNMITKMTASPASATLKGPKSLLDPITQILTKPVDVNGVSESFKKETTFDLAEGIQHINPTDAVLVEIVVEEKMDLRNFQGVPVKGLNTRYSYHISPSAIEIKVKGPANILDKPDIAQAIDVHIDLEGLEPGIYMKPATILLPVDITLIQVEPEIFTVEVVK